ncbi:MAG: hypothetical protein JWN67_1763 [Actinomycetia bacterium]|nr:hypothetical protein [Actinomycetes bacterium]
MSASAGIRRIMGGVERVVVAIVLVAVAVVVAVVLDRRGRADAPTQASWTVPNQLDRGDFAGPAAPWLVAVFTSATCGSCQGTADKAKVLACDDVAVDEVEVGARKDVHDRYGIDAVPTLVVADAEGVVRASFVGPMTATDLWAAVAEVRFPGSSPEPHLGQ